MGFQENLGCELNILRLTQQLKMWKESKKFKNKNITTLHLDIAQAFDSVPHIYIMKQLKKKGYSEDIIDAIQWIYSNTYIDIDGTLVRVDKGVIQGGILSPALFTIFYDTLLTRLGRFKYF